MRIPAAWSALLLGAGVARAATGLAFLKIDTAAGSAGQGETSTGWEDALSPQLNPALAPADDGRWRLALTRADWIFESELSALAVQLPRGPLSVGADLRVLTVDDIEQRTSPNPEPEGTYRVDDLAWGLNLSSPLPGVSGLRGGLALRHVQEKINQDDSHGWLGDLGLRWENPLDAERRLGFSAAVRNLGQSSAFEDQDMEAPRTLSLGVDGQAKLPGVGWPAGLAVEWRHLREDGGHLHLGAQLRPLDGLALRGGWMSGYEERGATLGAGFAWRGMKLDYAWLPFSNALDDVHRFTFSFAL